MYVSVIFTLCIVALAGANPAPEVSEDTKKLADQNQECIDETGITLEQLDNLVNNPPSDMPNAGMCYLKCFLEKKELEKDGVFQVEAAIPKRPKAISEEDARNILQECTSLTANDPCETSYIRYTCVFEKGGNIPWIKAAP